jgi:hypothetical protein
MNGEVQGTTAEVPNIDKFIKHNKNYGSSWTSYKRITDHNVNPVLLALSMLRLRTKHRSGVFS